MPDPAGPKPHEHPLKTSAVPEAVTPLSDGTHPPGARQLALFPYAELAVTTNFTFLTGASHPDEFVTQAAALGYHALAITDTNTLAGVVRAHVAAQAANLPLVCGVRLRFVDAAWLSLFVYPTDRASYGRLCRLLTLGKRRAPKGECRLYFADVFEHSAGLLAIAQLHGDLDVADLPQPFSRQAAGLRVGPNGVPEPGVSVQPRIASDDAVAQTRSPAGLRRNAVLEDVPRSDTRPRTTDALQQLRDAFDDDRLSLAIQRTYAAEDRRQLEQRVALARALDLPLVAINDAHYHLPERRALHDVLTCIRCGCTLEQAGFRLAPNAERHLKPSAEMARLFAEYPAALERSVVIARRAAAFSLDLLRYEYPDEVVPPGRTPMGHLRELTWEGAQQRYPQGIPDKITTQLEHEFALIDELRYAPYFLTVHDLVRHARSLGILCQGRGAAANSAVCYCLGVTAVNPDQIDILFERFVSRERREPPDIDIDFEHERREEVIQYIYQKYGRERAGLTAEVISYRGRSAVRDVGRALGLAPDLLRRLASQVNYWEETAFEEAAGGNEAPLQALGFDVHQDMIRTLARLARELMGFPRHLSQHVGGFVMTRGPLCELTPIENASMENRTTIEWDKDDIEALGILKVDVLGLGMLSCIRKAFQFIEATERRSDEATEGEEQRRQSDGGKTENPGSLFEHYDLGGSNEGKVVFSTSSLRRSVTPSLPSPTSSLRRSVTPSLPTANQGDSQWAWYGRFRDLIAWQKSMGLARLTYRTTARMPAEERFGLTNQMRRAAVSVPSNIAEGFGRQSRPDYIKHLRIARESLMELETQCELATSMKMIPTDQGFSALLKEVDRVLQGLFRGLERKEEE